MAPGFAAARDFENRREWTSCLAFAGLIGSRECQPHLSCISFLTDFTPLTFSTISAALSISAWELTKPLN